MRMTLNGGLDRTFDTASCPLCAKLTWWKPSAVRNRVAICAELNDCHHSHDVHDTIMLVGLSSANRMCAWP